MTSIGTAIILGAVQGLTEFLPISSSGHLLLARELLGANTEHGLAFDAVLQLGTLVAVFIYFRNDVAQLAQDAWQLARRKDIPEERRQWLAAILLGSIPAGLAGIFLEDTMATVFRTPLLVAAALTAGSLLFLFAEFLAVRQKRHPLTLATGLGVGVFQCLALVPGVSRSGATISGGLILGLDRATAARFSFLLSIPIIGASGLYKLVDLLRTPAPDVSVAALAVGFAVAAGVGYAAIRALLAILQTHGLRPFIVYRLALAAIVFAAIAI
jgi:undecaprenyl-diphosphatase